MAESPKQSSVGTLGSSNKRIVVGRIAALADDHHGNAKHKNYDHGEDRGGEQDVESGAHRFHLRAKARVI